ncbi:MAG: family 16 glycosylhydrolase [Gallionella sp.]
MFNNGWASSNAVVVNNSLVLTLDNACTPATLCSGMPYKSGEFTSVAKYGYGKVSAKMTAAKGAGIITSLFTYNATPHDEIDIEILGSDTTKMQLNYFVNGVGGHEKVINLGFDAALARHTYAFFWDATGIIWTVDGVQVHQVVGGTLPTAPGQIMVNLWPAIGVDAWSGIFTYPGTPLQAFYDYIRYD